ncbi:MAG: Undecaprenyl-phosphate 4-deoxy-4-formamido-L-arabinose transferase [Acidobacteria bacterium]|nr:Undecaprenyl-phosphate 4-deoxy-4-formamido-L-arabinose transferase [Acidobacteriota bacterium]
MERQIPDLSLIVPCYNEEAIIGYTIPRLLAAFEKAGYRLELIAVDNGSRDRTGEIIKDFAAKNPAVVYHRVEQNQGYGNGILSAIPVCTGAWIGMIPADGQVDAEDVARLLDAAIASGGNVLAKVRRRFRMDGFRRKVISVFYNVFIQILWPGLGSIDVNGNPKILPRELMRGLGLQSKNWLLDAEIVIKCYYLGVRIIELNVFGRMRGNGLSHVRMETCWEFLTKLLAFRFSKEWRREMKRPTLPAASADEPQLETTLRG